MHVVLAMTHHDPDRRQITQASHMLPVLVEIFDGIAVYASAATGPSSLAMFDQMDRVTVEQEEQPLTDGLAQLGIARRAMVALALQFDTEFIMSCDADRAFHWAEHYPEELKTVICQIPSHDFTVLGRTQRAFESHPRIQRDTEMIVNNLYSRVSGHSWDITAAARGMSRRAAEAIVRGCDDGTIGVDASWPLFIRQTEDFSMGYIETEGLEFETADRHGTEAADLGGAEAWIAELDADPEKWAHRLRLASIEANSMVPYTRKENDNGKISAPN